MHVEIARIKILENARKLSVRVLFWAPKTVTFCRAIATGDPTGSKNRYLICTYLIFRDSNCSNGDVVIVTAKLLWNSKKKKNYHRSLTSTILLKIYSIRKSKWGGRGRSYFLIRSAPNGPTRSILGSGDLTVVQPTGHLSWIVYWGPAVWIIYIVNFFQFLQRITKKKIQTFHIVNRNIIYRIFMLPIHFVWICRLNSNPLILCTR